MSISTSRKRIPYGIMDFTRMLGDNCYYVDKTRFIEEVEQAYSFFFYNRPRRFGKSLTLSMLRHYYDIKEADRFKDWYEGLYIYSHPTPATDTVQQAIGHTTLHRIIVYHGMEMAVCEEV